MKSIIGNGLKLLLISILFRIISYLFLSYSWQWSGLFIRSTEFVLGILYIAIWLIYGLSKRAGFRNGLLIGLIGTSDAVLLSIVSLVLYLNRSSYYFGPIEMMLWNVPLMGIINYLHFNSNAILYIAPLFAILLTALGSLPGKSKNTVIENKYKDPGVMK
jgi:hypothetical protein